MADLLKIIKLFQAFIELNKYNCNSSVKLESFLSTMLGIDLLLFKKALITNQDKLILQKAFQSSRDISHIKKGYLYELSSFKNIKQFNIRVIDLYDLLEYEIIDDDEKIKLQEIFEYHQNNSYNNYLSVLINDKYQIFLIETDILYTDLTKESVEIYNNIMHDDFIIQYIDSTNIKENNTLFEDYFVYLDREIMKQNPIETNIILRILVDYDLSSNNYFAYVEIEHGNTQNDEKSDNWFPLMEICFKNNEDEVYKFINKIGDILLKRVYYINDDSDYMEVAKIYYKLSYTYKDLLNFIKYMIFLVHSMNL